MKKETLLKKIYKERKKKALPPSFEFERSSRKKFIFDRDKNVRPISKYLQHYWLTVLHPQGQGIR